MKKIFAGFLLASASMFATPAITVVAALGPSTESASYGTFVTNVFAHFRSGAPFGDIDTSPSGFEPASVINPNDIMASALANGVTNWRGTLTPGGAFSAEYGTYLYFAFQVTDANGFTLNNVVGSISSNDPGNAFGNAFPVASPFNYAGCAGTYGVDFRAYANIGDVAAVGACPGGAVRELVYVGPSLAVPFDGSPADLAAAIAEVAALGGYSITGAISATSIDTSSFGTSASSIISPEPTSFVLSGFGLLALGAIARRFRR